MGKNLEDFGLVGKKMVKIPSDTRAGVEYTITRDDKGLFRCNCEGWQMSKKRLKTCKHVRRMFLGIYIQAHVSVEDKIEAIEELFRKEL